MARKTEQTRQATLAEVGIARLKQDGVGTIKAFKLTADALATPVALAIAQVKGAGVDVWTQPTQAEYAAFWKLPLRTAQREWALYRHVFGEEARPETVAARLVLDYGRRLEEQGGNPSLVLNAPATLLVA